MGTADIKNYIIGIAVFTLIIMGGMAILGSFMAVDSTNIDPDTYDRFNETFNKYEDLQTSVGSIENSITEADTDFGLFGVLNALIGAAWNSLILTFSSLSFMNIVFGGLYSFFGVPIWIGNLLISIITLIIAFAIYEAIFNR